MGDAPNSLVQDHESRASWSREIERSVNHDKHERDWDGDWFNVEVDVTSFVEWLHLSIASARRKQLGRKLSRRLFEYPFWSIETVLCWIIVRDANRLQENLLSASPRRRPDTNVESQAEMRLLRMLKDGKLKAQDTVQVLPCGYWTDCVPIVGDLRAPIVGDLSAASPSLRLSREDVLRIFPETLTRPCSYVRARRQARIDRVIHLQHWHRDRHPEQCDLSSTLTRAMTRPTRSRWKSRARSMWRIAGRTAPQE
jgi:hypothetical protein